MILNKTVDYYYESYSLYLRIFDPNISRYSEREEKGIKLKLDQAYSEALKMHESKRSLFPILNQFVEDFSTEDDYVLTPLFMYHYKNKYNCFDLEGFLDLYLAHALKIVKQESNFEVFDIINSSELSSAQKWSLYLMLTQSERVLLELEALCEMLKLIIIKAEEEFKDRLSSLTALISEKILSDEFDDFMNDKFNVAFHKKNTAITFSVFSNQSVVYVYDHIYYGFKYTLDYLESLQVSELNICRKVKLFGDQNKYNILLQLIERDQYGLELADNLGLSAALVSYHVQDLLNEGFVVANADEASKRVYYTINKKNIKAVLDYIIADLKV